LDSTERALMTKILGNRGILALYMEGVLNPHDEEEDEDGEGELYNKYNEPYRKRLNDGDSITVSS
jgi:hypothetical protein